MKNHEGKTTGVIQVLNKRSGFFSEDDQELLAALASSAAISIENSRLFVSVVSKNVELMETKERLEQKINELDALVEAHDADELERAVRLDAETIGINARDLSTFEIDRRAQLALVARAPRDRVVVAESGIASRAQGAAAELAGADAILVGSTLMRSSDPPARLAELLSRPLVKVCGLTREEDVAAAAEAGADLAGFIRVEGSPRRADGVLSVPDTMLSVSVYVGEPR